MEMALTIALAEEISDEKSLTPELVEEWIEKVFYFPDGHIEVQWREPVTGKIPSK